MWDIMTEEERRLIIALEAHKAMNDMRAMIGLEPDNAFLDRIKEEGVELPDMSTPLPEQTEEDKRQGEIDRQLMMETDLQEINAMRVSRGERPLVERYDDLGIPYLDEEDG